MAAAIEKICDPALFGLEDAIEQARAGAREIPDFDLQIVRFLQPLSMSRQLHLATVFRGLDVLGGLLGSADAEEARLLALRIRPLLRSSAPEIVSKCVLLIGRRSQSMGWVHSVMTDSDERIRANLIESLWNRREDQVEEILKNALADPHPRVAANAVYGLYLIGNDAWIKGLDRLIGNELPAFRKSGIWVIKFGSLPDAPARVRMLIRDPDPGVRRAAFDALIHVRDAAKSKPATVTAAATTN
jgi:hypothetical protein